MRRLFGVGQEAEERHRSGDLAPPLSPSPRLGDEPSSALGHTAPRVARGPEWRVCRDDADWVAIDLETTGLSPRTDRVVEVGIARYDKKGTELESWTSLINPLRDMGATRIHGITAGDVRHAPTFSQAAPEVLAMMAGARLAAHNARFDLGFLDREFERASTAWGDADAFCTMTVPYRLGVVKNRRLTACCAELGIPMSREHAALSDARATASILFRTLERARRSPELPAIAPVWEMPEHRVVTRQRAEASIHVESSIASLADRIGVPDHADVPADVAISYLGLLDRVLEDRRITEEEVQALTEAAQDWSISASVAADLHRAFLAGVGELALADGVITAAERADVKLLTELLGVGPTTPGHVMNIRPPTKTESFVGLTVCFTGESVCTIDGVTISRDQQEQLAIQAGVVVRSGVSRKVDILVLADPDSASGKARKADDLGIRKIAEPVFWRAIGVRID